jgi:hypothetical protein
MSRSKHDDSAILTQQTRSSLHLSAIVGDMLEHIHVENGVERSIASQISSRHNSDLAIRKRSLGGEGLLHPIS